SDQLAWCNSLGYRMPRVRDLTNSNYNNLGATPSSSVNYYMRYIGAGFFTEWGLMNYYADAGFIYYNWWTSDAAGSNSLLVNSGDGNVAGYSNGEDHPGLCSAP
ncbi:MAG: hypothetical protein J6580_11605, partial [Gilliamella sp.]